MTLRDYINIYIIKYKLKKNSVKNTMWKKNVVGFYFLFLCCSCCCCYFIHGSSHSFMSRTAVFFCCKERSPGEMTIVPQLDDAATWTSVVGPLWRLMRPQLHTIWRASLWCFDYIFCSPFLHLRYQINTACPTTFTHPLRTNGNITFSLWQTIRCKKCKSFFKVLQMWRPWTQNGPEFWIL